MLPQCVTKLVSYLTGNFNLRVAVIYAEKLWGIFSKERVILITADRANDSQTHGLESGWLMRRQKDASELSNSSALLPQDIGLVVSILLWVAWTLD